MDEHKKYGMLPSYYLGRVFGLAPCVTLTSGRVVHMVTVFVIMALFLKYTLEDAVNGNTSKLGTFVLLARTFCISATAFVSVLVVLKNNPGTIQISKDLARVDFLIRNEIGFNLKRYRVSILKSQLLQILFTLFVLGADSTSSYFNGLSVYIYLFLTIDLVIQTQFVCSVLRIKTYYSALNDSLRLLGESRLPERDTSNGENKRCGTIVSIRKLRRNLNVICDNYNSCYSIPILLSIGTYTTNITFELYQLYKSRKEESLLFLATRHMFPAVWNFIVIGVIIFVSSVTSQEAMLSTTIVNELMNKNNNDKFSGELEILGKQLQHEEVQFSPCGFYVLDRLQLTVITSGIATYLIILVQFQMST